MKRTTYLSVLMTLLLQCGVSVAQSNVIDEIVWVVGDEAIYRSEVEETRRDAQKNGIQWDGDPYCIIPEQLALNKLFMNQAELDSIFASDEDVADLVQRDLNNRIEKLGSQDKVEEYFEMTNAGADAIVIDTAHGHTQSVIAKLKEAKASFKDIDIVVGNIATGAAAKMLVEAGADAVKVGMGPGSICTTRIIAGIGVPQVSAVYDVYSAIKGSGVPIIADGGLRYSGDVVKALAAGGDSVMFGSLVAGTEESPGETIIFNGRKFKSYRGMGSLEAMENGSKDRYFQADTKDARKLVPEGIAARVPYKGTLYEVVYQLAGGLRSGMGYCGAPNIEKLHEAKFVRITNAGMNESHPHDVAITSEAPNYSRHE